MLADLNGGNRPDAFLLFISPQFTGWTVIFFKKIADEKSEAVCSIFLLYIFPEDTVQEVRHCVGCKSSSRNWEVSSSLSTRFNVRLWAMTAAATLLSASCLQISNLSSFIFVNSCLKNIFCLIGREERVFFPQVFKSFSLVAVLLLPLVQSSSEQFQQSCCYSNYTKIRFKFFKDAKIRSISNWQVDDEDDYFCPWKDAISSRKK